MLLDNKKNGKVGEKFREYLSIHSRLSIISGLFSIYGFEALKQELTKVESAFFLFSDPPVSKDGLSSHLIRKLNGDKFERRFQNQLNQTKIARECINWLSQKAQIKAVKKPHTLNQNLFHINNQEESIAISGSSHFTASGLGYCESDAYAMNICSSDTENTKALLEWFDSIWKNKSAVEDIKELFLDHLESISRDRSPEFIYFLILFNIFKDYLGEIDEEKIIKTKTGFKDTIVWSKLYKFQKDGVMGAIDKLEKHNGCIIADSVGLGKTFEALAVIKYYELRNDRVLVIVPKKLRENWTIYTINDKRNIFSSDRFNFDVLNHTDLTRFSGMSGEINLETLNWGNYDLVVIDESHNFRNNNSGRKGITRYARLMNQIIRSGVKTKVLMLSATPVNNRMNDLKNQVAFITEGIDDSYADLGIFSIEQTLKKAQTRFNQWLRTDSDERRVQDLLEMMNFDYFQLLDLLTIARSRKHIEKYYDIKEIGEFPKRLAPINIKEDIDLEDRFPPLRHINRQIRRLNLSAYAPLKYVKMEKREEYSRKYDVTVKGGSVFKQVDREQSLIHLLRVNILKRMESSINSFAITLEKLLRMVNNLIERVDTQNDGELADIGIEDIEIDSPDFEAFLIGNKIKVLLKDIDRIRWKQDLEEDRLNLSELLNEARQINQTRDAKLNKIKDIITWKCDNPINLTNKKIIIFTAFADTAMYLYQHIAKWAYAEQGIHSALVTGSNTNKTTLPGIQKDLNSILTFFSPVSKERDRIDDTLSTQIDILIATDCISEGQNLQDCDYLINYDIHWNPVRIIQRFGRIDRLGSKNKKVQLVNFWPNMELDEYINLEARVSGRMVLLDISATGEENVIEYDEKKGMNDLAYRRRQLKELQENVVDLEDISGGISITDLTLNDFRMDLSEYMKNNMASLEKAPSAIYAVTTIKNQFSEKELEPGVIFCLKNISAKTIRKTACSLEPYYLAYVSDNGEIKLNFIHAKKILDILKKECVRQNTPNLNALELFNRETHNAKDMSNYRNMLETAIQTIIGKEEEKGVESLFSRGGTNLSQETFNGMEDFEVVCFLILNRENR
ncbi:helicase-related protein [Desulfobacula phenolica]|uniref:Superfamily II DNA or RNA helicase, SNF2 family n=1 Tax=Desulfobacula phenolica TaxID=90732 RepID=A0A1H2JGP2_9BACT|nr:helicase-related protein [Desulfobacula phenolica]SDU55318.1 Superfamily II DNA or RNA helicase, SNF2 family [Desulfobacula phenolica]